MSEYHTERCASALYLGGTKAIQPLEEEKTPVSQPTIQLLQHMENNKILKRKIIVQHTEDEQKYIYKIKLEML